jgi:hypothetical protein
VRPPLDLLDIGLDVRHRLLGAASRAAPTMRAASQAATTPLMAMIAQASRQPTP